MQLGAHAGRVLVWVATTAIVVLGARTLAYALVPAPNLLATDLAHETPGPSLAAVVLVAIGLAIVVASTTLWLAALAVRERHALERIALVEVPRVRLGCLAGRALGLWILSSAAFALLESYIHWRAGLGWHGLHCLVGPVHRNAIPLLAGLSLVAVAIVGAVELLVSWTRRILAILRARRRPTSTRDRPSVPKDRAGRTFSLLFFLGPRAPPLATGF